ncbi:hypothetical protein ARMGADRAFT_1083971 [Armillaria gallica]|uniref:Protein kinase domain-containing protein n=1 Tax=Armillaria gallica TaxID=47427 RepID=A0A2H3DBS1_ARMGA|nr:hypothetical protein ARMGADRAFT_1083971 [Armillaria gallica]
MCNGWSGALSRSISEIKDIYDLDSDEEYAYHVEMPKRLLEITDAALFYRAADNEPCDLPKDESSFAEVLSQLEPPMLSKYIKFPLELDTAMIRTMLGSVEVSSSFRPTERLEQHINETFANVKMPLHMTELVLPLEKILACLDSKDRLPYQVSGRMVPITNHLYEAASFPYRWFCGSSEELLVALRDLRDSDGHIIHPIWSSASVLLTRIDPISKKIARPLEIAAFIKVRYPDELNLAGQAAYVVRPRENILPVIKTEWKNSIPQHSEASYAKALTAQIRADFWFTGARLGCFWDGNFMVMAQAVENGQRLDIHFSPIVAAGSRVTPYRQHQITPEVLHASVTDYLQTAKAQAEKQQEIEKEKVYSLKSAQKEILAEAKNAEERMEDAEEALRPVKVEIKAKIAKEKYEEAKAALDDLQDGECYVSDIYRGLNSYGLFASVGILAARDLPPRHAQRKPCQSLPVYPHGRDSKREVNPATEGARSSAVALDTENDAQLPLPYVECGRNILAGGLHGIVCDGTFHDLDGTTIPVVIKLPCLTRDEEGLTQTAAAMEHEFEVYKALHRIHGSTIPRLYGCVYIDDWYSGRSIPALVLEIAGENNLASLDISTLTAEEKIAIEDVLVAFHNEGWIHGDIAGRNILYSTDTNGRKTFRLCDLSFAEWWHCDSDRHDDVGDLYRVFLCYDEDDDDEGDDDEDEDDEDEDDEDEDEDEDENDEDEDDEEDDAEDEDEEDGVGEDDEDDETDPVVASGGTKCARNFSKLSILNMRKGFE